MPIYAYKCDSCGHAKDVLQKISDEPLSVCPQCGAASFTKQVTAAGFQLKGSGWYATDFKGGAAPSAPAVGKDASTSGAEPAPAVAAAAPAASAPPAAAAAPSAKAD
jgi:putative FmdB family regulatory protein